MKIKTKSSEYWQDRFVGLEKRANAMGIDAYSRIEPVFRESQQAIHNEIDKWYSRIAKNNEISIVEAKKMLSKNQLEEFRWTVDEYIKFGKENAVNGKWIKQLENASAKYHITRLEALQIKVQNQLEIAFGNQLDVMDDMAEKIITQGYYRSCYELSKGLGIGFDIATIDERKLNIIKNKPWATDGKNFSNRIWHHKSKMVNQLHRELTKNCLLGKAPDEAIKHMTQFVDKKFKNARYQAGRLVMTEQAYFSALSQQEAFNELDVEEFEVVATLDSHTSEVCKEMDGKHFAMSDYAVGMTSPPFHPWCFDKQTEVLTNNGFKLFKDLLIDDLVYTVNPQNLMPEWQKPIKYIRYNYEGNMIYFKNKRFDMLVTENHRMLVQNMDYSVKDKSLKLKPANSIGRKSKHRFPSGIHWIRHKSESINLCGKKVDIITYLKFMAYFLADGSSTPNKSSYNIKIAQCDNDWMWEDLKDLPFTKYKCKEAIIIRDKELGKYLRSFGKCNEKYIPNEIKSLNSELIRVFLMAYSKTDGTVKKGKLWKEYKFSDSITFFTTSNQLASDLGELILKAGGRPSYHLNHSKGKKQVFRNGTYTINHNVWSINWNKHTYNQIQNMDVTDVYYNDEVFCVEVPKYHTLYVRRNGKCAWSGNCRSCTCPYFDDEFTVDEKRVARDKDGNIYEVPSNMKYEEWKNEYVDKPKISPKTPFKTSDKSKNEENLHNQKVDKSGDKGYNESKERKEKIEIPKTLSNFEQYSKDWENNTVKSVLNDDEIELIGKEIKKLIDENEYSMRVGTDIMGEILKDGRFKNQFETGTSGGTLSKQWRKKATHKLFGVDLKGIKYKNYEKYGYLGDKDLLLDANSPIGYGDVIVRFDKNKLRNKVTYTLGDSLGNACNDRVIAGNISNPRANGIVKNELKYIYDVLKSNEINTVKDFVYETNIDRYLELQYHGELTMKDVKEICFTDKLPNEEVIKELKNRNIKLYKTKKHMDDYVGGEVHDEIIEIE